MKKDNPLDLSEFTVLMPEKKRSELMLNVRENGEIQSQSRGLPVIRLAAGLRCEEDL